MRPYEVGGVWYRPHEQPAYDEIGVATWYGAGSPNRRTADGEVFNINALTAAHTTLPLPCLVEVTSLDTGARIEVRVNDRGPFLAGRIIDLSPRAARDLGIVGHGSARVRVRYLGPASGGPAPIVDTSIRPATVAVGAVPVVTTTAAPIPPSAPIIAIYRIRAAAFADRANADRAAAALSGQGVAHVETIARGGMKLYRVEVDCPADVAPLDLRRRVIDAGFPGAQVVGAS